MKKYRLTTKVLAVAACLVIVFSQNTSLVAQLNGSKRQEKRIDKIFSAYDNSETPGVAVAIVKNGRIIFKKGYGIANLNSKSPVTSKTVFNIGSVSKQFTVFMTLLLEKDGKLSIDDDIRQYLPEMHKFDKAITLRHLITHTSGLKDVYLLSTMAGWRQDDVAKHEQKLRLVFRQKELGFTPGERFSYSNTGTMLLSEIIARVSGITFAEFARERVFKPLGMNSTFIMTDFEKIVENMSYSYYKPDGEYRLAINPSSIQGYSNIYSTVEDMSLWAMNFANPKIGDSELIKKMRTKTKLNSGEAIRFAMGQNFTPYKGLTHIEHTGSHRAYLAYLGRFPEQNISIVLLSNNEGLKPNLFGKSYEVADLFLSKYYDKSKENIPSKKAPVKTIKLSGKQLDKFSGLYWNEEDKYSRKIYIKDGMLMYFRGENNESQLAPIGGNKFQMLNVDVDLKVKFGKNKKNKKTMTVIEDDLSPGEFVTYKPANYTPKRLMEFIGRYYSEELDASYTFRLENGKLFARHLRLDDAKLTAIKTDLFKTNQWFFNQVKFIRDKKNKIVGLHASNVRVNNVWFKKVLTN